MTNYFSKLPYLYVQNCDQVKELDTPPLSFPIPIFSMFKMENLHYTALFGMPDSDENPSMKISLLNAVASRHHLN